MLAAGSIVLGRYHIVRQVGRGGMGTVYEATDSRLRCRVALKEMRACGAEAAAAFEHEAQLLASLRHPVLPAVIDHFVDADGQFLVMQFIAGEDLATGLSRRGTGFALADVLPWLDSLFGAIEYLHAQQPPVVHRDIKPANLKLTPEGEIALLDFGLAKGAAGADEGIAALSVLGYTPRYSPIEQVDGTGTDPRSDIYALGATVYHLLTGVAPPNALARATALVNQEPDPLRDAHAACAEVPAAIGAVLARALAVGRGQRYGSVAAMRADLRAAVARPESAAAAVRPETRARRVDAAVPSRAQVGTRIDLIVQVRFPDSPRLGLEDWPSRRLPDAIEQTSEVVRLAFPVDLVTGRAGPARLQVSLVAPDFLVEGEPQRTIDVPPDAYSQRLSFLLTAARPGLCRINVEVYAADSVFLGSVPVETDVGGAPVEAGPFCVSHLVLSVIAREVAAMMAREAVESATAAATVRVDADTADALATLPVPPPRHSDASAAPPRAAAPPAACKASPVQATRRMSRFARRLAPVAALVLVATAGVVYFASFAARPAAPTSQPSASAPATAPPAATPPPSQPTTANRPPGAATPAARPRPAAPATSATHPFVSMRASALPTEGGIRVRFEFENAGNADIPFALDPVASVVRDATGRRYRLAEVQSAEARAAARLLRPGHVLRMEFDLLPTPTRVEPLTVTLVSTAMPGGPVRFAPLVVTVR